MGTELNERLFTQNTSRVQLSRDQRQHIADTKGNLNIGLSRIVSLLGQFETPWNVKTSCHGLYKRSSTVEVDDTPFSATIHHNQTLCITYESEIMLSLALLSLLGVASAQQAGTLQSETHPKMSWSKCSSGGSCSTAQGEVVIDSNWRWVHNGMPPLSYCF